MTHPVGSPSPRAVAERVLDVARTRLQPMFVDALVRATARDLGLDVTEDELDAAGRALPAAATGRQIEELHVVAAQLLAANRAGARPGPRAAGGAWQVPAERRDRCADVVGTELGLPDIADPTALVSREYVTAAGVLAVIHQYGDRIGFFRAVDQAVRQLDGDELCIEDDDELLAALYCYEEIDNRIPARERARLAAKVLGVRDPDLPEGVSPDPAVPGLLDDLLEALNDVCDPGILRHGPTPAEVFRLESAARAVQVRLSSSMTGLSALRVRDLQLQFLRARDILRGLAPYVRPLCRPAAGPVVRHGLGEQGDEWVSVGALLGTRLPDGTDLFVAARTARAWRSVFEWLADAIDVVDPAAPADLSAEVCESAAVLRPGRARGRPGWVAPPAVVP